MTDVCHLFPKGIIPNASKIKALTAPLKDCLDISSFSYGCVEADGRLVGLGNSPDVIEIYHETKGYLIDPHISHPHLLRSGVIFVPDAFGAEHLEPVCQKANIDHILAIILRSGDQVECCHFGVKAKKEEARAVFYNYLDVLYKFITYFKREAYHLIEQERQKGFNIKETRGSTFIENDFVSPLLKNDPNVIKFLKLVMPLSAREQECLELFKQGESAQTTGAILGLSPRTVEFYFENIKNKLGCQTKSDLLQW